MPLAIFEHRTRGADPALVASGWTDDLIRIEETPGRILLDGGRTQRSTPVVQYLLRVRAGAAAHPLAAALLEVRAAHLPPDHGLDEAWLRTATRRLHVPMAFATNGHQWVMYDGTGGFDRRSRPVTEFPKPAMVRELFERATGISLGVPESAALVSNGGGDGTRRPHEDAAARAILLRLARGDKHALVVLSAGTRPAAVPGLIIRRLAETGMLVRGVVLTNAVRVPLYRDILGDTPRLRICTPDDSITFDLPPTHIFVDECVSAHWDTWREVLGRADTSAHIGITDAPLHEAVPSGDRFSDIAADVLAHFGAPAYTYSFSDATDAGWVSALELVRRDFVAGRTALTPLDDAFQQLCVAGGPEQQAVIISSDAASVAAGFEERYAAWIDKAHGTPIAPYTAPGGPIVVVPPDDAVRHARPEVQTIIVMDEPPPLQLQRIVTRAAATDVVSAKMLLRVIDFAGATRYLAEPIRALYPPTPAPIPAAALPPLTQTTVLEGAEIRQTLIGRYVVTGTGDNQRAIGTDELGDELARAIIGVVRERAALRTSWLSAGPRRAMLRALPDEGRAVVYYRAAAGREDAELYDVLAELGWGIRARSREARAEAFSWRHADWLSSLPTETGNVVKALLRQFVMHGTERLDDIDVLELPDIEVAGGMRSLRKGGAPVDMLRQIRERIFSV
jgi:type I restriction enzyme R subunit